MRYRNYEVGGNIVKKDERYIVTDNTELNNLFIFF